MVGGHGPNIPFARPIGNGEERTVQNMVPFFFFFCSFLFLFMAAYECATYYIHTCPGLPLVYTYIDIQ